MWGKMMIPMYMLWLHALHMDFDVWKGRKPNHSHALYGVSCYIGPRYSATWLHLGSYFLLYKKVYIKAAILVSSNIRLDISF